METSNQLDIGIEPNQLLDRIRYLSKSYNIKKWDIGLSTSKDVSVQVDNGNAKQSKGAQRSSITIRIWNNNGQIGITSTTDISDDGLRKSIELALQASKFGNKNDIPDFSPKCHSPLPEIDNPIKQGLGILKLFDLLKEAESKLINSYPAITSVPYNGIGENSYQRIYINSDGALRNLERTQASIYLYSLSEEVGKKPRSSGSIKIGYGVNDLDIEDCINEAANKTISHLNYKPITTGKYLVCFSPEAFLDLISAFSNIFNARQILDGISLSSKESIGKSIAVPYFSLFDNALHPSNIGASSFDGEGTPTSNIRLVNGGILENLLHSEATARAFGVEPTGHAGMGAKVSVGPDWFVINRTDGYQLDSVNLNYETTKDQFVLIESLNALHAGVKASQGSFSLPFDGWLVKNREKVSIEAATVAGDIRTVLNSIVFIEKELKETHQGVSPHIWVEDLSITGEA